MATKASLEASDKIMATIEKEKHGYRTCETKKLRLMKVGPVQLKLDPEDCKLFAKFYYSQTHDPRSARQFKHLLKRAYRDWFSLVHINNKKVKK